MNRNDLKTSLGFENNESVLPHYEDVLPIIQLKLLSSGFKFEAGFGTQRITEHAADLVRKINSKFRSYPAPLCPTDQRIQDTLDRHFGDVKTPGGHGVRLPESSLHMDFHGLARTLSLPPDQDTFTSPLLQSHRVAQGVLHNPASDKRTTQGTFHVSEGGLPIPADKKAVPRDVFARLFWHATHPTPDLMLLPFTSTLPARDRVRAFTSLFLRPRVSPEVPGLSPYRDMEIRFFAPASLVSNLDFVESIFGNAGDPYLPENDPGLDVEHFCGATGLVLLAPHLVNLTKKELGLPHVSNASERQKRDGMCWEKESDKYNEGGAFKCTFRTAEGVILTLIADNYYGYCKKEVKTQIGFAANLSGRVEEEHSGGALVFPSYNLGDTIRGESDFVGVKGYTYEKALRTLKGRVTPHADGYAVDNLHPTVIYIPEDATISLPNQTVSWKKGKKTVSLLLAPENVYIYPSGYKARMEKHPGAGTWRLIGTRSEGTLCHKPCTVSGGGKSEISKSVADGILYRNVYVQDLKKDFDEVEKITRKDYATRFRVKPKGPRKASRPFLSPLRSLGSVVRLLTPSPEYTDAYNEWLRGIPAHVRNLALLVKRCYRPEWGDDYRAHFSVDLLDGRPGHEIVFNHKHMMNSYLKAGADPDRNWMVFRLRSDYVPARKLQIEDDITVSVTLPAPDGSQGSLKFVENCEYRLFQRPDDAIHPGKDKQAEADLAGSARFISNFEPLPASEAKRIVNHVVEFDKFTEPMRHRIRAVAESGEGWFVASNAPRLVGGKPTPNVRYLQDRPDVVDPREFHIAEIGARLRRALGPNDALWQPVQAVLVGRRNNPPEISKGKSIPPLAVYNPLHFQELPEAFMDFVASLTGKSPSTTGAGSEGAMTKGPFNALWSIHDLNNAFTSYALTGLQVFSTPAGHVGRKYQVDHDISLLMPEIWARLSDEERDANTLIAGGYLERIEDFKVGSRTVEASRLGWRINEKFLHNFFGRVFSEPTSVFPADMLQPELQSREDFIAGVNNIVESQRQAALFYFEDGSVDAACPPLKALLHVMAHGQYEGMTLQSKELRALFNTDNIRQSEWYRARLERQKQHDIAQWAARVDYLHAFIRQPHNRKPATALKLAERLAVAEKRLAEAQKPGYVKSLVGTIGLDAVG